ncbi:MAG: NlpC/P60 family protein [Elusimicrobiaceae bacterium]
MKTSFRNLIILFGVSGLLFCSCGGSGAQEAAADDSSVTADFAVRDALPQSDVPERKWSKMKGWGPTAAKYPEVSAPEGKDPVNWKRARIIAAAKKYIGLPYRHHHIPGWNPNQDLNEKTGPGLDCSNFTSWVYNYGLGIKFNSDIEKQSDSDLSPGRKLADGEKMEPGDLLFILERDRSRVSHVIIFVDEGHIIDSTDGSVELREFKGWYKTHLSHVRRVIE